MIRVKLGPLGELTFRLVKETEEYGVYYNPQFNVTVAFTREQVEELLKAKTTITAE
ncbi:MAG: hypothetical protein QXT28_11995 [Thermofilaceae archaeon]